MEGGKFQDLRSALYKSKRFKTIIFCPESFYYLKKLWLEKPTIIFVNEASL